MCPEPFSWAKNKRKLFSEGKSRGPLLAGAELKTRKRLFGCKFFHNGHVEDLQCCPLVNKAYSLFNYEAKRFGIDVIVLCYTGSVVLRFTFLLNFFYLTQDPFGEDGFSVPLSQRSFFFQFFRGFEMLLVLHNRLRHVNR